MDYINYDKFSIWPQIEYLDIIYKNYPNSKYVLHIRNIDSWITSFLNTKDTCNLIMRMQENHVPSMKHSGTIDRTILKNFIETHIETVKKYFENNDNFIVFDIDKDNIERLNTFIGVNNNTTLPTELMKVNVTNSQ